MNDPLPKVSHSDEVPVALRPERPDDEDFLLELYASTRLEEMALAGWDAAARALFVKMQFNAMRQGYAGMFPRAQFSILLLQDNSIGRMVVNRVAHEIRLVDLALLPDCRGRGLGTGLLQSLLAEACEAGKPVRLQVLKTNRAVRLYARLGFLQTGGDGLYDEMEWLPPT
jgi:ribosomal protein S18 acetylase RimI-like enzyme